MPEIRHYVVQQIREVKIDANSASDAAQLAEAVFEHGHLGGSTAIAKDKAPEGVWGNATTRVREIDLHVKERR